MAELRRMCERLGLEDVSTLLNSGNVVFRATQRDAAALETRLERETAKRLGVKPAFFVRTADEWASLVKKNPFPDEAKGDPGHLRGGADAAGAQAGRRPGLRAAIVGRSASSCAAARRTSSIPTAWAARSSRPT